MHGCLETGHRSSAQQRAQVLAGGMDAPDLPAQPLTSSRVD